MTVCDRLSRRQDGRQSRSPDRYRDYDRDSHQSRRDDSSRQRYSRERYSKQSTPGRSNSRDRRNSLDRKVRFNSDKQVKCFTCGNYGHYAKGCAMPVGEEPKE